MANLSDLAGTSCPRHGSPIAVLKSGKAFCDEDCETEELQRYAASLNGHLDEIQGTKEASVAQQRGSSMGAVGGLPEEAARTHRTPAKGTNRQIVTKEPPAGEAGGRADVERTVQPQNTQLPARTQQDDFLRRVPPHDNEAEMSVLGAALIDNEAIGKVPWLTVEMFYRETHRVLYRSMLTLRANAKPIDAVTLSRALKTADKFEQVGGAKYIGEVVGFVPAHQNIEHYAAIVRDMHIKREIASRAGELVSLAYNGVSADALIGEMERSLRFDTGGVLPALITNKIEIISGLDFYKRQQAAPPRRWLVDGFLARKEISLWSGKVEAGKTTAMRTLVMSVLRGDFFLERGTYPSKVLYVMLDADGVDVTFEEFTRLGWSPENDEIDFLIDPVMAIRPNSFQQFHQELLERKPGLVVIDPLGRFQKIDDITDYGTTYAMAQFSELAKQTDCHIALLHHIPRGRSDDADPATAGFGSIAIAGGCNARFTFVHKKGDIYTILSSKGKGGGFKPFESEQTLKKDPDTGRVMLDGPYSWKDEAKGVRPLVVAAVSQSDEWLTSTQIGHLIGVQRSVAGTAAKMAADAGDIKLYVGRSNKYHFCRNGLDLEPPK